MNSVGFDNILEVVNKASNCVVIKVGDQVYFHTFEEGGYEGWVDHGFFALKDEVEKLRTERKALQDQIRSLKRERTVIEKSIKKHLGKP